MCIAIDLETTGLDLIGNDFPFAVSMMDDEGGEHYWEWDVNPFTRKPEIIKDDIYKIRSLVEDRELVFHNAEFDLMGLDKIKWLVDWRGKVHDTGIQSHIHNNVVHQQYHGRLKELALHYLDIPDTDEEKLRKAVSSARAIVKKNDLGWNLAEKRKNDDHISRDYWLLRCLCNQRPDLLPNTEQWDQDDMPFDHPWYDLCQTYAMRDVERTIILHLCFNDKRDDKQESMYQRERELIEVLYDMHKEGISVSPKRMNTEFKRYGKQVESSINEMRSVTGDPDFNPDSPIQLRKILYDKLKFEVTRLTAKAGEPSTDAEAIKDILIQTDNRSDKKLKVKRLAFINPYRQWRGGKTAHGYIDSYKFHLKGYRLHPSVNQVGTSHTRVSSSNPNGQNVGKGKELEDHEKPEYNLRLIFGPELGRMWYCLDYNQLQLRLFAGIAGEKTLLDGFARGLDAHTITAMAITGKDDPTTITKLERRRAKNVNFGFIFGASPAKIEETAGMPGLWSLVIKMFPSAHKFMEATKKQVYKKGYVTTPHGYKLWLPEKYGKIAAHAGVNYIVAGCEGDIVKQAMISCHDYLEQQQEDYQFDGFMSFQVHDELIFDFPQVNHPYEQPEINDKVSKLQSLMESPALKIGIETPVDIEWTTTNWSDTTKGLAA